MNRLTTLLENKKEDLLTIYFTAGYPNLDDTATIIQSLQENKVDIIEVGIPYSDPLADGPTIQRTGSKALENGMTLEVLFSQLKTIKDKVEVPLVLMGNFNQFLQYGAENFLQKAQEVGVSGFILPDLPLMVYENQYKALFEKYNQTICFLATPQSEDQRIQKLAKASSGFLYVVSSAATTGAKSEMKASQIDYFERINGLGIESPKLIGFGISSADTYQTACNYSSGAIIGSAFLNAIKGEDLEKEITDFVSSIR